MLEFLFLDPLPRFHYLSLLCPLLGLGLFHLSSYLPHVWLKIWSLTYWPCPRFFSSFFSLFVCFVFVFLFFAFHFSTFFIHFHHSFLCFNFPSFFCTSSSFLWFQSIFPCSFKLCLILNLSASCYFLLLLFLIPIFYIFLSLLFLFSYVLFFSFFLFLALLPFLFIS